MTSARKWLTLTPTMKALKGDEMNSPRANPALLGFKTVISGGGMACAAVILLLASGSPRMHSQAKEHLSKVQCRRCS
jgi:hypothetical protein